MLGLGLSLTKIGGSLLSIVKAGLKLWYKADTTQSPLGEEGITDGSFASGPDLFDPGKGTFDNGVGSWKEYHANTIETVGSQLKVTNNGNSDGAYLYFRDSKDLSDDLIIGKTYEVTFDARKDSGANPTRAEVFTGLAGDYLHSAPFTNEMAQYKVYFTARSVNYASIKFDAMNPGASVFLDNISIKQTNINDSWLIQNPSSSQTVEFRSDGVFVDYVHDAAGTSTGSTGINQPALTVGRKYKIEVDFGTITGQGKIQAGGKGHTITSTSSDKTVTVILDNWLDTQEHVYIVRKTDLESFSALIKRVSVKEITNSVRDYSSSANNGMLYSGKALDFDGSDDYLSFGSDLNENSTVWSLAFWLGDYTQGGNNLDNYDWIIGGGTTANIGLKKSAEGIFYRQTSGVDANAYWEFGHVLDSFTGYKRFVFTSDGIIISLYIDGMFISSVKPESTNLMVERLMSGYNTDDYIVNGKCSDFQLYSKTWTPTDVEYDWENPDKDVFDDTVRAEVLGPENIINGDFSTSDLSGWNFNVAPTTGTRSIVNGKLEFYSGDATPEYPVGNSNILGNYNLVGKKGDVYRVEAHFSDFVGNTSASLRGNGIVAGNMVFSTSYSKVVYWTADADFNYFGLNSGSHSDRLKLDNFSIKKVLKHKSEISVTDCKALYRLNEGAGDRIYNAAPVLSGEKVINNKFELGIDGWLLWDYTVGLIAGYDDGTTITCSPSSQIKVGMTVTGTGIPIGAVVASVEAGAVATFELSVSTTGGPTSGSSIKLKDGTKNGSMTVANNIGTITSSKENANVAYHYFNANAGTAENLTTGALYNVKFKVKRTGGGGGYWSMNHINDDISSNGSNIMTEEWSNVDMVFTAYGPTNAYLGFHALDTNTVIQISDLSLKEITPSSSHALVGNPTWATAQPYIPQYAMSSYSKKLTFSGAAGEYVTVGAQTIADNAPFGISMWYQHELTGDNDNYVLGDGASDYIRIQHAADAIYFHTDGSTATFTVTEADLSDFKLAHLCFVRAAGNDGDLKLYINGVLHQTIVGSSVTDGPFDYRYIGNFNNNTASMNGFLDEVSVFNKELSATEVSELFSGGVALDARNHSAYLGSELITNGDFSNGTTDWAISTSANSGSISINNEGQLVITSLADGNHYGIVQQALTTSIGKVYQVKFDILAVDNGVGNGADYIRIGVANSPGFGAGTTGIVGNDNSYLGTGNVVYFKATSGSTHIGIGARNDITNMVIDNVSVKEVDLKGYWRNNGASTWTDLSLYGNNGIVVSDVIGTEIVDNGTFNTNTSSWIANSGGTLSLVSNQLKVQLDAGDSFGRAIQPIEVVTGARYKVTGTIVSKSSAANIMVDKTTGSSVPCLVLTSNVETATGYFVADETTTYYVACSASGDGADAVFDNISIMRMNPAQIQLQEVPYFGKDSLGLPMNRIRERGLNLDGTGYVEASSNSSLDVTSGLTLEAWVKAKDFHSSYNIINKKTSWNTIGYGMYRHVDGHRIFYEAANGSDNHQLSSDLILLDSDLDSWVHIVVTHNAITGVVKFWRNGESKTTIMNSSVLTGDIGTNTEPLRIGQGDGGSNVGQNFNGVIDDVKVYDRALTASEVAQNYKKGLSFHTS